MTDRDTQAIDRARAALAGTAEAYVRLTAGDVVNLATLAGKGDDPVAVHAATVVLKRGAGTAMSLHRDVHVKPLLDGVPA